MGSKLKKEIFDLYDFEEDYEFEEYFEGMTDQKASTLYSELKEKTNIKKALELLNEILKSVNFKVSSQLYEELLLDDELVDFIQDKEDSKNPFIKSLAKYASSGDEIDDDMDEEKEEPIDADLMKTIKSILEKKEIKESEENIYKQIKK